MGEESEKGLSYSHRPVSMEPGVNQLQSSVRAYYRGERKSFGQMVGVVDRAERDGRGWKEGFYLAA